MALFDRMAGQVARRAQELADAAIERAEAAVAEFPDVRLRRDGDALVIEGMGLARRWMNDIRLRFVLWGPSTSFASLRSHAPGMACSEAPPPRAGEDLQ